MTPTFILPLVLAAIVVATLVFVIVVVVRARAQWKARNNEHGFLYEVVKDVVVPVFGSLVLASLGFWFGFQLDRQRGISAEHQSKDAILRDMMTTRNGPDVAFFTAVGERLTVHLQQYERFRRAQAQGIGGQEISEKALFDEKAIYFFYGMFRVAVVDFLATKGYVLYPRVWMEEAFEGLTDHVAEHFVGTKEREDVFPEEEAALYRYFGASKATYHTGGKRPDESGPDLFEFNLILAEAPRPESGKSNPYYARQVIELQKGFQRFQERLHSGKINPQEIIVTFEAMIGLDDYAFNTLFSHWYKQFEPDPPVEIGTAPPKDFLPYPLRNFQPIVPAREKEEWADERKKAWSLIFNNVPLDLRKDAEKDKSACAGP